MYHSSRPPSTSTSTRRSSHDHHRTHRQRPCRRPRPLREPRGPGERADRLRPDVPAVGDPPGSSRSPTNPSTGTGSWTRSSASSRSRRPTYGPSSRSWSPPRWWRRTRRGRPGSGSRTPDGRLFTRSAAETAPISARIYAGIPAEDLAAAGRVLTLVTERANAELAALPRSRRSSGMLTASAGCRPRRRSPVDTTYYDHGTPAERWERARTVLRRQGLRRRRARPRPAGRGGAGADRPPAAAGPRLLPLGPTAPRRGRVARPRRAGPGGALRPADAGPHARAAGPARGGGVRTCGSPRRSRATSSGCNGQRDCKHGYGSRGGASGRTRPLSPLRLALEARVASARPLPYFASTRVPYDRLPRRCAISPRTTSTAMNTASGMPSRGTK